MASLLSGTTVGGHAVIHAGNIAAQSVNYANSAGSVAWTNVSSRPTHLSQFTNDLGNYGNWITSSALANYVTTSQVTSSMISGLNNMLGVTTLPYAVDITVGGDPDRFYAVQFWGGDQDVWRRIIIKRGYSEPAPWDPIGTGVHHGGLLLDWEGNFGGWGGAEYADRLRVFNESYTNVCADMFIWSHSMGYVFMLRGGGALYHLYSDQAINGFYQAGSPDILYSTSTLSYDDTWSGTNQYDVPAPAPLSLSQVNSSRIDGLRTKKQSLLDARYLRQGVDISGIGTISSTNFLASNAYYLNGTSYYLNSSNGGIYTNARFESGTLIVAPGGNSSQWNTAFGWGNHATAGYLTSLPSHTHDDRYLPIGGGWYGVNLPGSRWGGYSANGGEVVFGRDLPNNGQMGMLIDGAYLAGENNGFWSLPTDNNWNGRRGMSWDGSYLDFTTNSPTAQFTNLRLANGFEIQQGGSNYGRFNSWVHLNGHYGLYSDINGAHIYPNNGSYGSWRIEGSRNSYRGLQFSSGVNGDVSLMIHTNSNITGFHNTSYDWQFYWNAGTLYCFKNNYGGGTQATVLDSSNFTSWAASASHTHDDRYYTESESDSRFLRYYGVNAESDFQRFQDGVGEIRFDQINDYNNLSNPPGGYTYGGVLSMRGDNFGFQIWGSHTGDLYYKTQWSDDQYSGWRSIITSANIGSQSVNYATTAGSANSVAWTNVSGRPTAVSSFTNDSGYITSASLSGYVPTSRTITINGTSYDLSANRSWTISASDNTKLPLAGGTMSGRLTLSSISGVDQMVENDYGSYLHIGGWGIGRTDAAAVLVNTAYRADYADSLFDMNISRFTNNSGYVTSSGSVAYATSATRLYASDGTYVYGGANPYYLYMNYDGGSYWELKVSPATPGTVRVAYANSAGSASSASTSSQVTINYNNDSNSTYQLLWGSGNSVYGTSQVYVNPYSDVIYARGGYISPGNPWGTADSAYFPNGITTAGSDNWIYGHTYIGNAPGNGNGHEFWANGNMKSTGHHYLDNNYGQTIVGRYSSTVYQGVWAMGDSYKLPLDGSSTGSLYGLAWSHPNAGGVASNLNTHGLLVMENGTFLAAISGSIRARDDVRAPAIYDSGSRVAISRGEGRNYVDYSRYVYNNGAYSGSGWIEPSDLGVRYANSANYATSAGSASSASSASNADRLYPIGAAIDNTHPGYGLKVWYDWAYSGTYRNGLTLGSHPSDQAYGWQIWQNMWDDRTYTRRYNGGWQSTRTLLTAQDDPYAYNMNQYVRSSDGPTFRDVYVNGWFRNNNSREGLYNQANGNHFYSRGGSEWVVTGNGGNIELQFWSNHESARRGYVYANTSNEIGFLNSGGSWSLRCDNSGNVTATGDVTAYSDVRIKTNIKTYENALEKVLQLRGVTYNRTDNNDQSEKIGVIAQEIEQIIPQVVSKQEDGLLTVSYGNIVGVLIEAIKEQQKQIEVLKSKIN